MLSRYRKDGKIKPDCQDVILNTWLDIGYDPFFIFKILDYFHYLVTDPRTFLVTRPFQGYQNFWPCDLDLLLKNFNLGHSFITRRGWAFILHMCTPCDKAFPWVPNFLTKWPWPWNDLLLKNFNLGNSFLTRRGRYLTCAFLVARPLMLYHDFLCSDLDLEGWPTL